MVNKPSAKPAVKPPSLPRYGVMTSENNPISVDWIPTDTKGFLGITFAPGKKGPSVFSEAPHDRDMVADVQRLRREFRTDTLINLMEPRERELFGCADMPEQARAAGMLFIGVPVPDLQAVRRLDQPDYDRAVITAARAVKAGAAVVVSCRGGRGRAGTFAACVLTALGKSPDIAIARVRKHRGGAIETPSQEAFIKASGWSYHSRYRGEG